MVLAKVDGGLGPGGHGMGERQTVLRYFRSSSQGLAGECAEK